MGLTFYFIGCFFLGSFPTAFVAAKMLKNIDIRQHGSGNVGATNVLRVLGTGPGVTVFAIDFLKGALPAWLLGVFFPEQAVPLLGLAAGLSAVLGHMFTPFLNFKGGKGVATASGALCAAFFVHFLATAVAWWVFFYFSRIVSLSSLGAVCALLVSALLWREPAPVLGTFSAIVLLVFWSHRSNISRLMKGEEHRFSKKTK
jgi:acyl phosphate:glycerol-3-phosphate acyltransferase